MKIIPASEFKSIPWKNGQGETTELAINDGADLSNFTWRISMATVVDDGLFSNFSGYTRNLVLIEGNGITLQHDHNKIDKLTAILDIAEFDGGCETLCNLPAGAITDFNIITSTAHYQTKVETYPTTKNLALQKASRCFLYSLTGCLQVSQQGNVSEIPSGALLQITDVLSEQYQVSGQQLIIAYLREL